MGILTRIPATKYKNPTGTSGEPFGKQSTLTDGKTSLHSPLATWEMEGGRVQKVLSFSVKSRALKKMRFESAANWKESKHENLRKPLKI